MGRTRSIAVTIVQVLLVLILAMISPSAGGVTPKGEARGPAPLDPPDSKPAPAPLEPPGSKPTQSPSPSQGEAIQSFIDEMVTADGGTSGLSRHDPVALTILNTWLSEDAKLPEALRPPKDDRLRALRDSIANLAGSVRGPESDNYGTFGSVDRAISDIPQFDEGTGRVSLYRALPFQSVATLFQAAEDCDLGRVTFQHYLFARRGSRWTKLSEATTRELSDCSIREKWPYTRAWYLVEYPDEAQAPELRVGESRRRLRKAGVEVMAWPGHNGYPLITITGMLKKVEWWPMGLAGQVGTEVMHQDYKPTPDLTVLGNLFDPHRLWCGDDVLSAHELRTGTVTCELHRRQGQPLINILSRVDGRTYAGTMGLLGGVVFTFHVGITSRDSSDCSFEAMWDGDSTDAVPILPGERATCRGQVTGDGSGLTLQFAKPIACLHHAMALVTLVPEYVRQEDLDNPMSKGWGRVALVGKVQLGRESYEACRVTMDLSPLP